MLTNYLKNYDSQEDDDYNPTQRQQAIYRQQQERKQKNRNRHISTHDLWLEINKQYQTSLEKQEKRISSQQSNSLQLANNILNNKFIKPDTKIIFAGKQFLLNQQTGQLELIQKKNMSTTNILHEQFQKQQDNDRHKVQLAFQYLNHVIKTIYNRGRKINSIGKSKIDWKGFVKQQGIQEKLKYNRKAGQLRI